MGGRLAEGYGHVTMETKWDIEEGFGIVDILLQVEDRFCAWGQRSDWRTNSSVCTVGRFHGKSDLNVSPWFMKVK